MRELSCKEESILTTKEKAVFQDHLSRLNLDDTVWHLFQQWVDFSTPQVRLFYLKVHSGGDLVGLGLFLRMTHYDLGTSYASLRKGLVGRAIAATANFFHPARVVIALRNLVTSNLSRPFFCVATELEEFVMAAMLNHLKADKNSQLVTIVDTLAKEDHFQSAGFSAFPCPSEAWFDPAVYKDIGEYLKLHRSLKKNLKRRKKRVDIQYRKGALSREELLQVKACLDCSIENSRALNPCQLFFERHMDETDIFHRQDNLHILVLVDGTVAGFHTFHICGECMGGVVGGFNRERSRKFFAYERVITASLDYAINHGIKRIGYSLIDNHTKLRLVDRRTPCRLYVYSRRFMQRKAFEFAYPHNDLFSLYQLEHPQARR